MNATITLILVTCAIVLAIAMKKRNSRNNKKNPDDPYNNFHLGEMTSHDIPARFTKREKEYARWSSRQTKKADTLKSIQKEGEALNGKESRK